MPRYIVNVERMSFQTVDLVVEARTSKQAAKLALEKAKSAKFSPEVTADDIAHVIKMESK